MLWPKQHFCNSFRHPARSGHFYCGVQGTVHVGDNWGRSTSKSLSKRGKGSSNSLRPQARSNCSVVCATAVPLSSIEKRGSWSTQLATECHKNVTSYRSLAFVLTPHNKLTTDKPKNKSLRLRLTLVCARAPQRPSKNYCKEEKVFFLIDGWLHLAAP